MRDTKTHPKPPLASANFDLAPPGYKRTDAGVIPQDWGVSTVGTEFTIQLGKMLDATKNIGIAKPYIGNRAVQWGRIDLDAVATVAMSPSDLQRFRLQREDLLVCEGGETGRSAIWDDPIPECYHQKALHRLRATHGYDVFLMMSLLQLWASGRHLANYVTQTSIAHLPKDKFELVPIPVPPPAEQSAIANALSDADALIVALEKLIAKKQSIKQAAMQQLLTGRTRLPGFTGKWEKRRIGDLLTVCHGRSQQGIAVQDGKYPILASGGEIGRTDSSLYDKPSVLIGRKGTIDDPQYVSLPFWTVDTLFYTELAAKVCAKFMFYKFCMILWRTYNEASGVPSLNARTIESISLKVPQPDEQEAIAAVLSDMDAEIEALERRCDKTKQIKKGVMQQLLTGRVRLIKPQVVVTQIEVKPKATEAHSWAFNEAVVISTLAKQFGSEQFPLGRKRYTKLSYLLHRHADNYTEGYLKKVAGPYNPKTKYGGPERIAVESGYIREHASGPYRGFVAAENIAQAEGYFAKWYPDGIKWLAQFRLRRNDDLEVLTTVDMAALELRVAGKKVDVAGVKDVIRSHSEWKAKLDRTAFSDTSIGHAIKTSQTLFG